MDLIIMEDKKFITSNDYKRVLDNLDKFQRNKVENHMILNIIKDKISNREPLGIQVAQSTASMIIQDILSSYHNIGISGNAINGIKRYKDLTELTIKNHDSSCIVYLNNNNINPYRFIYTIFNDFFKFFKCFSINGMYKLYIKIDQIKLKQYKLSLIELFNIIKIRISELYTFIDIILLPEFFCTIIVILDDIKEIDSIRNMYICGIEKIINIKIFDNQMYFLTVGSNLSYLLAHKDVNKIKTISNNINDVYSTLGLESARKVFIQELSNLLSLNSSNPNILFIADTVTIKGVFMPINSIGLSKMIPSLLVNMTNEKTKNHMKLNIPFGSKVFNENISEQTITGSVINIGTGAMYLYRTQFIRII